jgi:hypothetical protein
MRKWIVLAAACCFGVAFAASLPIPHAQAEQEAAQARKPHPPQSAPMLPASSAVAPAPINESASLPRHSEKESRDSDLWHGIKAWVFKFAEDPIALFTFVLAFFTIRLWKSTDKLWQEARDAGITAKVAANAAEKAAKVAENALLNVERPYLVVSASQFTTGIRSDTASASQYLPVVTYSVINHGKLPAIIDMVCAEVVHAPDERLSAPLSVDLDDPLLIDRTLGANEWRQGLQFRGSTLDAATVQSPNLTDREIFFWIVIRYHGPFTRSHETSGCWRVVFNGNKMTLLQHGGDDYNYIK